MTKEIVNLQIGTHANYVGAHFWNLQDEYLATPVESRELSPSAFFRETAPSSPYFRSGLQYAPRLQVIDACGAFGALSTQAGIVLSGALSQQQLPKPDWGGELQTFIRERVQPSSYTRQLHREEQQEQEYVQQKADEAQHNEEAPKQRKLFDDVRYWSDFLKTRVHPRSCTSLPGVHYDVTNLQYFSTGYDIAFPLVEDFYDSLRYFIEECDSFGGLNLMSNADDAFAGITASYISHIVDELGASTPILTVGVQNEMRYATQATAESFGATFSPAEEKIWSQNEARLVAFCQEYAVQYVPISSQISRRIPMLHVKNNVFHTSAALGLALDAALTPLSQGTSLTGVLSLLRPAPFATFGSLVCNVPKSSEALVYGKNVFDTEGTVNLSDAWKPPYHSKAVQFAAPLRTVEVISARGFTRELAVHAKTILPVTIPIPFPTFFDQALARPGAAVPNVNPRDQGVEVEHVSLLSGLATVPCAGRRALQSLSDSVRSVTFTRSGDERARLDEVREALQSRADDYDTL
ncbi:Protein misato [Gracilariopsis chorda]|uniref:Protein misato n=1 Tax=Gracilariopsis chorda TaxID=448386 RepID=A0A2V3J119_9FLOR|nr:Protein misato [Gracilariopsis chorda]|eukprot:PXF48068.1 Protein misato [Gracilariopsis chorda]